MVAHKLQGRTKLYGFEISIENAKGSVRRWYDPHGKEAGRTKMYFDYGYIRNTKGTDGDHVDVYVGPDPEAESAYVINQMKKPPVDTGGPWTKFDEQKVMLAFPSAAAAKAAYLKQYDDPRFFGGMKEMSVADFKAKVLARENHGKKVAQLSRLIAELNLSKLAAGEPLVIPSEIKLADILGDEAPGVTMLPAITNYAQATMSKQERKEADREMKTAGDRVSRIADRIDDVGIATLAAPYAASAVGHGLARAKNPKLKALGAAVEKGLGAESSFGKSHGREIAGLAMVAPGVTHTLAKGVDKVTKKANGDMLQYFADHPEKLKEKQERDRKKHAELEKIAQRYFEDYEYKTEREKTAIVAMLGRLGGLISRGGKAVAGAGRSASSGLSQAVARTGDKLRGGFIAGERGVSQAVGERASRMARTPGSALSKVPVATAPAAVAGGVPIPVAAPAAKAGLSPKWNPLSTRNLVMGGAGVTLGLGAYGGYKGIQTASNLLQHQHDAPLAAPGVAGTGRVF
jgi:hypothetical protein